MARMEKENAKQSKRKGRKMNEKKAKELRREVYGKDYPEETEYTYGVKFKRGKFGLQNVGSNHIVATGNRRMYQTIKHGQH